MSRKPSTILPPSCRTAVQRSKRMRGSAKLCLAARTPSNAMIGTLVKSAGEEQVSALARTLRGPL